MDRQLSEILDEGLKAFRKTFGGGMLEYDRVFFEMKRKQCVKIERTKKGETYDVITPSGAEISRAATDALLADFVKFLKEREGV